MYIAISIVILLVISFLWALLNLSSELSKPKELTKIKEKLKKEKILFKRN